MLGIFNYYCRCIRCVCAFTTNSSLQRHIQNLHSEQRNFVCPYCRKSFKTYTACKRHIKTHKPRLALQLLHKQRQQQKLIISPPTRSSKLPYLDSIMEADDENNFQTEII